MNFEATLEDLHWREREREHVDSMYRPSTLELLDLFPDAVKGMASRRKEIRKGIDAANESALSRHKAFLAEMFRSPDGTGACPLGCGRRVGKEEAKMILDLTTYDPDLDYLPDTNRLRIPGSTRRHSEREELHSIERLLKIDAARKGGKRKGGITEEDVIRAKAYPIDDLIEVTRRDGFVNCIFHGEKTPSMKVYRKENRWWCYGACADGGDTIDYVMRSEGLDFVEAVKRLSGK